MTIKHIPSPYPTGLVWLRRDLRLDDHTALYHALAQCQKVYMCFVFDRTILDALPEQDRRVDFIHQSIAQLNQQLAPYNASILTIYGDAHDEIPALVKRLKVDAVFANRDFEPTAIARDVHVAGELTSLSCAFQSYLDHVIIDPFQLKTGQGKPYTMFTPYKNQWLKYYAQHATTLQPRDCTPYLADTLAPCSHLTEYALPPLTAMGFAATGIESIMPIGVDGAQTLWQQFQNRMTLYHQTRDFPAIKGVSYLSVHLRFGTLSIRRLAATAWQAIQTAPSDKPNEGAQIWLNELIWREFYVQILANFPHVAEGKAFKPEYDRIEWATGNLADEHFDAWCNGQTGYPLVDAAMHQLNQTGYMHNRLRMVTASFLVKDLGIDWRRGEAYFAAQLNDFDLSANNGGWQWAASSGCDAQPYFRIFNPITQSEKFDATGKFIRKYLPQLSNVPDTYIHAPWLIPELLQHSTQCKIGVDYPHPIVQHDVARQTTLARYAVIKSD
jgi:deoxyribodipyrimidine photo-lyase